MKHKGTKKQLRAHLLDHYATIKGRLGRQPRYMEFIRETGHYNHQLKLVFGGSGWKEMLLIAGDRSGKWQSELKLSAEILLNKYQALKVKLNKKPTFREFYQATKHGDALLCVYFGRPGWSNLQKAAGDFSVQLPKNYRKKLLQAEYHRLKQKLGRQPTLPEFTKHSRKSVLYIRSLFGNSPWRQFLAAMGEKIFIGRRPVINKRLLLNNYMRLRMQLGKKPSFRAYHKHYKHHLASITKIFGRPGWRNLQKAAGDNK